MIARKLGLQRLIYQTRINSDSIVIRTLSIDNEMHDDDVRNSRRIGSRVLLSAGKTKVKQCVVLRRRRVLVL